MWMQKPWISGLIVTLTLGGGGVIAAQIHEHGSDQQTTVPAGDVVKMHETMMASMHAREAKLASLVKTMDGATGEAKIDTMATIIRELVQSEKEMHAGMIGMMNQTADGKP